MEDTYKKALHQLKRPSSTVFKGFSVPWNFKEYEVIPVLNIPPVEPSGPVEEVETEKEQMIDSLAQFSAEKLKEMDNFSFEGGNDRTGGYCTCPYEWAFV